MNCTLWRLGWSQRPSWYKGGLEAPFGKTLDPSQMPGVFPISSHPSQMSGGFPLSSQALLWYAYWVIVSMLAVIAVSSIGLFLQQFLRAQQVRPWGGTEKSTPPSPTASIPGPGHLDGSEQGRVPSPTLALPRPFLPRDPQRGEQPPRRLERGKWAPVLWWDSVQDPPQTSNLFSSVSSLDRVTFKRKLAGGTPCLMNFYQIPLHFSPSGSNFWAAQL